jgi:hypothetical protein
MAPALMCADDCCYVDCRSIGMELDPFTMFVIFVALMLVMFLVRVVTSSRRNVNLTTRECKACGAMQPGFARFCRRCGKAL